MRGDASVASRIVRALSDVAQQIPVADVRIGLGYTAVRLEDDRLGLAYTFRDEAGRGCSVLHHSQPLAGRPASDLLARLESADPIEAGVGLACANALGNRRDRKFDEGDILDHLGLRADDDVSMVGHFGPLVEPLSRRVRSLVEFERDEGVHRSVRPAAEATGYLPRCQVALITATSIINHTIDGLLEAARECREVALLGASTPLLPEVFSTARVTLLSGVVVEDPERVLQVVSEGGGTRAFRPHVRKVNLATTTCR
jgi:uncharacterized protein (DUF4213/DUF364 family)